MRPRGGTARRRDDHEQEEQARASVEDIGRQLRSAREERGLDLLALHDRLSRPITMLEALESGDLAALPDQAQALSTLRRYAAFLGLDGDALALQMLDAWSIVLSTTNGSGRNPTTAATNVVTTVTSGPDHLRAFTQTGEVPRVGASASSKTGVIGTTPGPPTGTFPVVPRQDIRQSKRAVAKARRRLRAPTSLKVITWVAAGLVLCLVAGFAIYQWSPQTLASTHILRMTTPHSASASSSSSSSSSSSTGKTPAHASAVTLTSFGADSAAYSGNCWIQVTSSNSTVPLAAGVQPPGKVLSFPNNGTITVEVGSSAVLVGVTIDGKAAFINTPKIAPFTYTFAPAS
jgi:cytoskeletal protein RodZ